MKKFFLFFLFASVLTAQIPLAHKGKDESDITIYGQQDSPASGTFTVLLIDKNHPSGYLKRPGCWAKEIGSVQNAFTFENDEKQITVKAPAGSTVFWECHGFMAQSDYEKCIRKSAKTEEAKACPTNPNQTAHDKCMNEAKTLAETKACPE